MDRTIGWFVPKPDRASFYPTVLACTARGTRQDGDNSNCSNKSTIPEKYLFDPTPEEKESGIRDVEIDGDKKRLYWCPECRGKDDSVVQKGRFSATHGEKHPDRKHDKDFFKKRSGTQGMMAHIGHISDVQPKLETQELQEITPVNNAYIIGILL